MLLLRSGATSSPSAYERLSPVTAFLEPDAQRPPWKAPQANEAHGGVVAELSPPPYVASSSTYNE